MIATSEHLLIPDEPRNANCRGCGEKIRYGEPVVGSSGGLRRGEVSIDFGWQHPMCLPRELWEEYRELTGSSVQPPWQDSPKLKVGGQRLTLDRETGGTIEVRSYQYAHPMDLTETVPTDACGNPIP